MFRALGWLVVLVAVQMPNAGARSVGSIVIWNRCDHVVHLKNSPAERRTTASTQVAAQQYSANSAILSPNEKYAQEYLQLSQQSETARGGWTISLYRSAKSQGKLQYHYCFNDTGEVSFETTYLHSNPWSDNWALTALSSDCQPRSTAKRYSTDDARDLEHCNQNTTMALVLCPYGHHSASVSASLPYSSRALTSVSASPRAGSTSSLANISTLLSIYPGESRPHESSIMASLSSNSVGTHTGLTSGAPSRSIATNSPLTSSSAQPALASASASRSCMSTPSTSMPTAVLTSNSIYVNATYTTTAYQSTTTVTASIIATDIEIVEHVRIHYDA